MINITFDRKPLILLLTLSAACAGDIGVAESYQDGDDEETEEVEVGQATLAFTEGFQTKGCSTVEVRTINDAMGVLLETATTDASAFEACIDQSPLVEFNCPNGQSRDYVVDGFLKTRITEIECYWGREVANAEAMVGIRGTKMLMDHGFIAKNSARRIASVVGHEIMHNRGYTHSEHDSGSKYYSNTVPEQVEACILNRRANPSGGPLTASFADRCDGGPYRTLRRGMQACPIGMYMTGLHVAEGRALCLTFRDESYAAHEEFIDTSTQMFGMDNCPSGYAMTGVHVDKSQVMCAPFKGKGDRFVEDDLYRQNMRACPVGSVMTGLHAKKRHVTCVRN